MRRCIRAAREVSGSLIRPQWMQMSMPRLLPGRLPWPNSAIAPHCAHAKAMIIAFSSSL